MDVLKHKFGDRIVVFVSITIVLTLGFCEYTFFSIIISINAIFSAMIASQLLTSLLGQLVCAVVFGFAFGGVIPSNIAFLKQVHEDFGSTLGLFLFFLAISSVVGPPIVGIKCTRQNLNFIPSFYRCNL